MANRFWAPATEALCGCVNLYSGAKLYFSRISQIDDDFWRSQRRFKYNNQMDNGDRGHNKRHIRWVNRNGTDFGSISTAA